jgi:hypothetical protein
VSEHFAPVKANTQAGFAPCFPVTDMAAALAHYEQLGFVVMPYVDGAQWAWIRFGNAEIHLYLKVDHDPSRTAAAADLSVLDCEALERQWAQLEPAARAIPTTPTTACAKPSTSILTTTSFALAHRCRGPIDPSQLSCAKGCLSRRISSRS